MTVSAILGVLALAVIAVVAFLVIGGGDDDKGGAQPVDQTSSTTERERNTTTTRNRSTTTTAPEEDLRSVATQLDTMLTSSETSRTKLNEATIAPFLSCRISSAQAVTQIGTVISERRALLNSIRQLQSRVTDPTAVDLLDKLAKALEFSISSNELYQSWFRANAGASCSTSQGATFRSQGDLIGSQASQAKESFLAAYNPVAASYGLVIRSPAKI